MAQRTVLLASYHFPPSAASGSFRLLGFARHLPKHDWRMAVVAPPKMPWEPVDEGLAAQIPPETAIYPVPYRQGGLFQRFAPFCYWLPSALSACRRAIREQNAEALLTSGPPHQIHLLGLALKRRYGIPWIADFRDPWITAGHESATAGRTWRMLEQAVMRQADVIVANAPGACGALRDGFPALESKFVTITNGFDGELFEPKEPIRTPADGEPRIIVHTGATYYGRDPRPFLDALKLWGQPAKPLHAHFYGQPPEATYNLDDEARQRGLEGSVSVTGQVSYADSLRAMMTADILLLLDSPGRRIGVPAKLYEYIGAGRPILALGECDGDLAWVLSQSGLPYQIAPPHDPAAIARALEQLVATPPQAVTRESPFTREALAGKLADLLTRYCPNASAVENIHEPLQVPGHVA